MSKKTVGLTTLRKNIERDSRAYSIKHKTHRYIQRLAELDERSVGAFLDVVFERIARDLLPASEVEQIIIEGEQEEQRRRQEAEANQELLLQKHRERRQSGGSS